MARIRTTSDVGRALLGLSSDLVAEGLSTRDLKRRLIEYIHAIPDSLPSGEAGYAVDYADTGPQLPYRNPDKPWR